MRHGNRNTPQKEKPHEPNEGEKQMEHDPCRRPDSAEYLRRKERTRQSELRWERYAKDRGLIFQQTGVEHHFKQAISDVFQNLGWNNIRFLPDYAVQQPPICKIFWAEVKAGETVERDAYHQYMELDRKYKVWIIFDLGGDELRAVRVRDVIFRESDWVKRPTGCFTYKTVDWELSDWKRLQLPTTLPEVN